MFPLQNGQQTHPKFVHKKNKIGQTKSNLGFLLFYFCQEIRREEINKKLEEAEQKEKEELSSQRKELFTERRTKQAALRLLQRKVDMAELVGKEKNPVPDLRLFSRFDLPVNLQWLTGFLPWHIVIQSFKVDHLDASHPDENTFASYSVIGRCPNPNLKKSIVFLLCSKKNGINMVKN